MSKTHVKAARSAACTMCGHRIAVDRDFSGVLNCPECFGSFMVAGPGDRPRKAPPRMPQSRRPSTYADRLSFYSMLILILNIVGTLSLLAFAVAALDGLLMLASGVILASGFLWYFFFCTVADGVRLLAEIRDATKGQ